MTGHRLINPTRLHLGRPLSAGTRQGRIQRLVMVFGLIASTLVGSPAAEPSASTVTIDIDPARDVRPISPWIYGVNGLYEPQETPERRPACTTIRFGGNRTSAYNWITNASNAGHDWHHQNDGHMGGSKEPGEPVRAILDYTSARGMAAVICVPTIGYVAGDKGPSGDVLKSGPDYLKTRFKVSAPRKGAPFSLTPDPAAPVVYQDEFAHWVRSRYPACFTDPTRPAFFALDNEPDLWASTHPRLRGIVVPEGEKTPKEVERKGKLTYEECIRLNTDYARAIKAAVPGAKVIGPGVWCWLGVKDLSGAVDAQKRVFAECYLTHMRQEERSGGKRLIDHFCFNHYSAIDVLVDGKKVSVTSQDTSPAMVAARLQAPRSFWDPGFIEDSWMTGATGRKPLCILPELRRIIAATYPGTGIAISEYNFGGSRHISGGLAQADFLGVMGREGVDIATWWSLGAKGFFALGAFDLYRNYDGKGGCFGDLSIAATSGDIPVCAAYASLDARNRALMTVVVINKTGRPVEARIRIAGGRPRTGVKAFLLTEASPTPAAGPAPTWNQDGTLRHPMPPFSASLLRLGS